jgi:ribosomal protein L34E
MTRKQTGHHPGGRVVPMYHPATYGQPRHQCGDCGAPISHTRGAWRNCLTGSPACKAHLDATEAQS